MGLGGAEVFDEFYAAHAFQCQVEGHKVGFAADVGDAGVEAVVHLHDVESHVAEYAFYGDCGGFVFIDDEDSGGAVGIFIRLIGDQLGGQCQMILVHEVRQVRRLYQQSLSSLYAAQLPFLQPR